MANPFRDVAAGALDLAGTPIDILGLGAGAVTGTASFLTGNGFWNGFVDNPFSQASQAYHDKVTDITGANEDSITRRLVGAADMLLAPTAIPAIGKKIGLNAAKKAAQKAGNLGRAAAAEKMLNNTSVMKELKNGLKPKTLAGNLGKYAVADSAFRMLMPGEGNATDSVLNKVALLYLGKKGFDKLRGSKAIDRLRGKYMNGDKTRADLAQMDPIEADRYKIQDFIDRIHDLERRVDIVDAKGASADIAHNLGLINNKAKVDLTISARDRVNQMEVAKLIEQEQHRYDLKNMSPEMVAKEVDFATVQAELGSRKETLLRSLLETEAISIEEFMNIRDMKLIDACKVLSTKYPNFIHGLPETPLKELIDKFEILRKDIGRDYFLTPGMKTIAHTVVDEGVRAGLVSPAQAAEFRKQIDNGTYISMASDKRYTDKSSVYNSPNPFEFKRDGMFVNEYGDLINEGVYDPRNTINTFFSKMTSELEAAKQNIIKKQLLKTIERTTPRMKERFNKKYIELKNNKDFRMARALKEIEDQYGFIYDVDKMNAAKNPRSGVEYNLDYSDIERMRNPEKMYKMEVWEDGIKHEYYVSKGWEPLMEIRKPNPSIVNQVSSKVNKLFTSTISGKFNILFLTKRIMYGLGESIPAVVSEFKKHGIDISVKDVAKQFYAELKGQTQSELAKVFTDAIEDETFIGKRIGKPNSEIYNKFKSMISEPLDSGHYFMENDVVGEAIRNSNSSISINGITSNWDKILTTGKSYWNWFNDTTPVKILDALKSGVDNAQQNTVIRLIRENFKDPEMQNKLMVEISKKMSDTRRRGLGKSMLGKFSNAIQDFMPYGATSLQGFIGKMEYLPKDMIKNSKRYLSKAYKLYGNKTDTAMDAMFKIGTVLSKLPDNVMFDVLWKTIAIPTAICYIWNNSNNSQSESYHSLKDYEKSNRFLLTNFAGPGINVAIPMDQEWSVLKNVFEIMLDSVFGLSQMDEGNPAFSYKNQLAWSIGQDIGLSLPVPLEALINMTGYKTNLDPTAPFTEDNMIEAINKYRYKRLNPEFATIIQTLTGKLGKILVNMVEDKDVFDYRYAIPFIQLDPHKDRTSETISFLNRELKMNPTPELKHWNYERGKLKQERNFYAVNGCTAKGQILGPKDKVLAMYDQQLDKLDADTYNEIT